MEEPEPVEIPKHRCLVTTRRIAILTDKQIGQGRSGDTDCWGGIDQECQRTDIAQQNGSRKGQSYYVRVIGSGTAEELREALCAAIGELDELEGMEA